MRGKHFGFLATLCTVWIAARVGFLSILPTSVALPILARPADKQALLVSDAVEIVPHKAALAGSKQPYRKRSVPMRQRFSSNDRQARAIAFIMLAPSVDERPSATPPRTGSSIFQPPPRLPSEHNDPFSAYVYSFIRRGAGPAGLASGNQYGGSQSGFVASYAFDRKNSLMLIVRGAIAHDRPDEREIAAGISWRPRASLPASLTVERRFRHDRPDAIAAYVAGGKSQVALPLQFKLDGFAQAGVISGKDGGPFFDASARTARPLAIVDGVALTIGGGVWGGGQSSVFRIDAGPTIGAEIPVGKTRLRLDADWRFRIAGDASPANGPALTLSTSF